MQKYNVVVFYAHLTYATSTIPARPPNLPEK
jgi:hypothetical protein